MLLISVASVQTMKSGGNNSLNDLNDDFNNQWNCENCNLEYLNTQLYEVISNLKVPPSEKIEEVQRLISEGADVDLYTCTFSPLLLAAQVKRAKFFLNLLEKGAKFGLTFTSEYNLKKLVKNKDFGDSLNKCASENPAYFNAYKRFNDWQTDYNILLLAVKYWKPNGPAEEIKNPLCWFLDKVRDGADLNVKNSKGQGLEQLVTKDFVSDLKKIASSKNTGFDVHPEFKSQPYVKAFNTFNNWWKARTNISISGLDIIITIK